MGGPECRRYRQKFASSVQSEVNTIKSLFVPVVSHAVGSLLSMLFTMKIVRGSVKSTVLLADLLFYLMNSIMFSIKKSVVLLQ